MLGAKGRFALLVFFLAFAGAFWGAYAGWRSSHLPFAEAHQTIGQEIGQQEPAQTHAENNPWAWLFDWWGWTTEHAADFYTGLLFVGTAFLVAITNNLAKYTRGLWKEAADSTRITTLTTRALQRAYVVMGGPIESRDGAKWGIYHPDIDNFGQTAAYIRWACAVPVEDINELPENPDYTDVRNATRIELWVGPKNDGYKDPFTPRKIVTRGVNQGIYGRVWFRDVFGEDRSFGFILEVEMIPDSLVAGNRTLRTRSVRLSNRPNYTADDYDPKREPP